MGTDTLLNAAILDGIRTLIWMQSKDAQRGRNRPQSIYTMFVEKDKHENESGYMAFASGEEFENYRARKVREVK